MDAHRFQRIKDLLLALDELPVDARAAFLERECEGDPDLKREVESLLAQETDHLGMLDRGALARAAHEAIRTAQTASAAPSPEQVGPYRVLGKLGEGGMGIVYHAEQHEPIRREVALKLLRLGLDSERVVARFESERQALALMDHPHIARVLDAGADDQGRPFVVMELVAGRPITDYVARRQLPLAERIRLFQDVCRGVQHAHQKGIIHRDLKPSNILVAEADGKPLPKIIDFGIAKAVHDELGASTLTQEGQLIGTLEYMSPEQARGGIGGLDTRTDVYSLGIILYQLITGRFPYETRDVPLDEALKMICEAAPQTLRGTTTGLRADVDLETIILKALEKEPDRRYSGAGELADDLERYLRSEPILARPPSTMYQVRKMVARNRGVVAAAGTVMALLVVFSIVLSFQLAAQRTERARAEAEAAKAQRVSAFLQDLLASADPAVTGGAISLTELLDRAAADLERGLDEEPGVRAALHQTVGNAYRALARFDEGRHHLEQAIDIRRRLGDGDDETADAITDLAALYVARNVNEADLAVADSLARSALATRQALHGDRHERVAQSIETLALIAHQGGRYAEAESLYSQALAIARSVHGEAHPMLASILGGLAYALSEQQKPDAALSAGRGALAILESRFGAEHPTVSEAQRDLGQLLVGKGVYAEAESLYLVSLATEERIRGPEHPKVADRLTWLSSLYVVVGRVGEAEPLVRRAIDIREAALGENNVFVAEDYNRLAHCLDRMGRPAESMEQFERSLAILRSNLGAQHPKVMDVRSDMASVAQNHGQDELAIRIGREVLAARRRHFGDISVPVGVSHHTVATPLNRMGRHQRALAHAESSLACYEPTLGREHYMSAFALLNIGHALQGMGRLDEAEPPLRESLEIVKRSMGDPSYGTAGALMFLGRLLQDRGKTAEARDVLEASVEQLTAMAGESSFQTADAKLFLSDVAMSEGRVDEAERLATSGHHVFRDGRFDRHHPRYLMAELQAVLAAAANGKSERLGDMDPARIRQALEHPGNTPGERRRARERLDRLVRRGSGTGR